MKAVILLIDAQKEQGNVLAGTLVRSGHDVLRVDTVLEAVRTLKKHRQINAVVFRDEYDDVDGFSVPELIRLFNIPSIAVTDDPGTTDADFSVSDSAEELLAAIKKIETNA